MEGWVTGKGMNERMGGRFKKGMGRRIVEGMGQELDKGRMEG